MAVEWASAGPYQRTCGHMMSLATQYQKEAEDSRRHSPTYQQQAQPIYNPHAFFSALGKNIRLQRHAKTRISVTYKTKQNKNINSRAVVSNTIIPYLRILLVHYL